MEVWEKLNKESQKAYETFLIYLHNLDYRESNTKLAEKAQVRPLSISTWKKNYNWVERAEAYDRGKEVEITKQRGALIKEHAYQLNKDLMEYITLLMKSKNIYLEDLAENGEEILKGLSTLEKRDLANEDAELAIKMIKAYKEFLSLIPEGREILEEEKKGENITIIFNPVNPTEQTTINVIPDKIEKIEED